MSETIDDVTIVGGGDAGLLMALCVQKMNPGVDVSVVDDFRQDVPQVGKSTYLKIQQILHGTLDIGEQRFISEVKPVWKASVYFRDWCGYPAFHYPFDDSQKFPSADTADAIEYYYYYYDEIYDSPDHRTRCEAIVEQGKSPWYFSPREGGYDTYDRVAYHLNTRRFNDFLRDLCRERGVSLVDDEIVDVDVSDGRVERVRSERQAYEADLYVDATGFNRVIVGELDREFVDFDLPLDSAYNVRVDNDLSEVVPATVVESGDHGWFWQIDTFDNRDRGYVFASDYVADEDALAEFLDEVDGDVTADDVAKYEFTSGFYERAWTGNCVAIGNAEGFVEPLQSTGLTANAHAAVTLSNLLSAHGRIADEGIRDSYNDWVARSWRSIYDFISVHYRYADGDTEFWEDVTALPVSRRVEFLEDEFDRNGFDWSIDPTATSDEVEDLQTFQPIHFYELIRNMGAESAFYESHDFEVSDDVRQDEDEYYQKVADRVDDHVTVEQFYRGIFGR